MARGSKGARGVAARRPFPSARHHEITEALARDGFVDAAALSASLGVAGETVRKDLITPEGEGPLRRTHGGAAPVNALSCEPDVVQPTEFASKEVRITKPTRKHPRRDAAVLLDAGATVAALVDLIQDDRNLILFTHALTTAVAPAKRPGLVVYTLGGRVPGDDVRRGRRMGLAVAGRALMVDVAFLGANGVSLERGLTTPDPYEAAVKRLMVQGASRRVLLADRSTFGHASACRFAELDDRCYVITDRRLDPAVVELLTGRGIDVGQA